MKKNGILAVICAAAVSTALVFSLGACSSGSGKSDNSVAAKVASETITEGEVTEYIENLRASYGATEDSMWAMYLSYFGSAESLRENVINYLAQQKLVRLAAKEKGLSVESSVVDGYISEIKARGNYTSDEAWKNALQNAGMTEEEYRELIEYNLLSQELQESFGATENPTDEEVLKVAQENMKYFKESRRSSHILFALENEETAKTVLEQLKKGEIEFADAVSEYSTDTGSAANGGDCGWDTLTAFVTEYQDGLSALKKGEMSDLVKSQYGYHIILCTDFFAAPEKLESLDELPAEFASYFKTLATTSTTASAFSTWLNAYKSTIDFKIEPMPKGLSYDIDVEAAMAAATAAAEESSSAESSSAEASSAASN